MLNMIRLLSLLVALSTVVSAKQNCYSCTSARDWNTMNSWNWRFWNESYLTSNLKLNSDNCDIHPWAVGNTNNCGSMCLKWQFTYIDGSGKTAYHTVRGCANELLNSVPHSESCPQYQHTNGGLNAPGGGPPGDYRMCFCTGEYCNPATKTAAFGTGGLLFTAVLARIYQ